MSKHLRDEKADVDLLKQFVPAWEAFNDFCDEDAPVELRVGSHEDGETVWQPLASVTDASMLQGLYEGLGLSPHGATRLPPLYEQLVLSYRWAAVDLEQCSLLPNHPAPDLSPLLGAMRKNEDLRTTLLPNGYIQFGQGDTVNWDPVCFDFRHRQKNGDCRVVRLDHEAILCHYRLHETAELASSFRELVLQTIHSAERIRSIRIGKDLTGSYSDSSMA